ncbi:ABSCISIC ACID-INSENSITIVE 5-like protein 2 [Dendrobium catenatum]|uniref:ABSCISIC ACID-INSENSITIVE 5-like protein 2 n=1 Tax=Dendrobium catenatum TaxID=906689 RepID=A0A2I0X2Y8_9ASPA|nr:ABSCISIC ACID-INSENSITIVE 5-like protein 2 [Dendrobium catenatum]PKU82275.1 ABSCISIC ACID-INSENSITIVE 5-like protein 2 [Dendrobium catenatum]
MGTQTIAATGGGGNGDGMQRPQIQSLSRQGSLYGLTLNEVQSQLGEPLHSMNLDELLKSVFPGEANQGQGMDIEGFSQYASSSGLQRQGSITMPHSLSKKTVDDVWRDIQQGRRKKGPSNEDRKVGHGQERQPTFGEMTLEDFLVKAGVVAEGSVVKHKDMNVGGMVITNQMEGVQDYAHGAHWLHQYHHMPGIDQQQAQQNVMDTYMQSRSTTIGTLSDSHMTGRKRAVSGDMADKLVDRRQKRMIKNRESAARSRARKQAYTNELENKVSRLEEENKRLKKQKELDKVLHYVPPPEPKYRLRRTSSALF